MSRLHDLIREMHRRSLWQVLSLYLFGSWVAYQVITSLTSGLGLPGWIPGLAVVLIILGLPVVLATAFVQEGVGGGTEDSRGLGAPSSEEPGQAAEREEAASRRIFTWRHAISGGVIAFALWGVIAAGWLLLSGHAPEAGTPTAGRGEGRIHSIAVLAFDDLSPEGNQAYFSDGISEEILDALAKVQGLRVAARSSSFQFKGANADVREVGEKLGVQTVLEGSVRRDRDRVRITAQLVSANDGFEIWSDTYDRRLSDIFALQEEIAGRIVTALGFEKPEATAPTGVPGRTLAAHDYYLLGLQKWAHRASTEDLEAALENFQKASREDSLFARAHAAKAMIYAVLPQWPQTGDSLSRAEAIRLGEAEAARATELDSTLAEPYAALCQMETWYEWAWEDALRHCRHATELEPSSATAHQWLAEVLTELGRNEEALAEARRAFRLDPLAPLASNVIAWIHNQQGDYQGAIDQSRVTLELDPGVWYGVIHDFLARIMSHDPSGVVEAFGRLGRVTGDSVDLVEFGRLVARADSDEQARQEAIAAVPDLLLRDDIKATLYLRLGDERRAMDWLETMYGRHSLYLPEILQRKFFTPLHTDPRFRELRRKVGLDRDPGLSVTPEGSAGSPTRSG